MTVAGLSLKHKLCGLMQQYGSTVIRGVLGEAGRPVLELSVYKCVSECVRLMVGDPGVFQPSTGQETRGKALAAGLPAY